MHVCMCVSVSICGEVVHSISAVSKMRKSWMKSRKVNRYVASVLFIYCRGSA